MYLSATSPPISSIIIVKGSHHIPPVLPHRRVHCSSRQRNLFVCFYIHSIILTLTCMLTILPVCRMCHCLTASSQTCSLAWSCPSLTTASSWRLLKTTSPSESCSQCPGSWRRSSRLDFSSCLLCCLCQGLALSVSVVIVVCVGGHSAISNACFLVFCPAS